MQALLDWLAPYSNLIVAAATSLVAVFSILTYRVYRLELKRSRAYKGRVAARIVRLREDFKGVARLGFSGPLPRTEEERHRLNVLLNTRIGWVTARMRTTESIFDEAVVLPPAVMAHLDIALVKMADIGSLLEDSLKMMAEVGHRGQYATNTRYDLAKNTQRECARAVAGALKAAHDAIPLRTRTWGIVRRKHYGMLLDGAALKNRSDYPDAVLRPPFAPEPPSESSSD